MPQLVAGEYTSQEKIVVVVWPAPDKDGDGQEVWTARKDDFGRDVERMRAKDAQGNEVFSYNPPEGFTNIPGYDHVDNYVKTSHRGQIVRQTNGEAICIKPGQALVLNAVGDVVEVLADEYAQHVWAQLHDVTVTDTVGE